MTELNGAEALYAFMGWLTSRNAVSGPFSGKHLATSAADLVNAFCVVNKLEIKDPNWHHNIVRPDDRLIGPDR
jgi:hypothetical protein